MPDGSKKTLQCCLNQEPLAQIGAGWYQQPWEVALTGLTIGLESRTPGHLTTSSLAAPFSTHYGWNTHDEAIGERLGGVIVGGTVHSARGFHVAEVYSNARSSKTLLSLRWPRRQQKRWRHMNGIYWYTLYGRTDDTPTDKTLEPVRLT